MNMSNIVGGVCVILGVVLFVFLLNIDMSRAEVVDCLKWQKEAQEYPNYYLLQWQAMQCEAHDISIDAPIAQR